ncbi:MAG: GntR family transcriptional regulator [Lachnospiraceae bacterium]|nr:GntR family transcriptional regulator [Lachnospiraceae bacterium]
MLINIDFGSDEAIYVQLRNQIVLGIAKEEIKNGESLPSVRQLADELGVNMHTVNKAYTMLKTEGYLTMNRQRGAVICIELHDHPDNELVTAIRMITAEAKCRNMSEDELVSLIREIYRDL